MDFEIDINEKIEEKYDNGFYIVAIYPYNFSWTYSNEVTDTKLNGFKFKNNLLMNIDETLYLKVEGNDIIFTDKKVEASEVTLETTKVSTNFRIRVGKNFIRHKHSKLYCEKDNHKLLFFKDSTWTFIHTDINPEHTFVIARYKEDINWTRYLPGKVIIYNKGPDDLDISNFRDNTEIRKVENVGREGHTYLYHIIENYDKLTERITFLQADPFDHSPHLIPLCCMDKDYEDVQSLSLWYYGDKKSFIPSKHVVANNCKIINGAKVALYRMNEIGFFLDYKDKFWYSLMQDYKEINPILDYYERCGLTHKYHKNFKMAIAALFSTKRENILRNKIEDYKAMIRELLAKNPQGGNEGYILERIWYDFFKN